MANSSVFICDRCESYMDEKNVHSLTIAIKPRSPYSAKPAVFSGIPTNSTASRMTEVKREICPTCAQEFVLTLNLEERDNKLKERLFENFNLPSRPKTS